MEALRLLIRTYALRSLHHLITSFLTLSFLLLPGTLLENSFFLALDTTIICRLRNSAPSYYFDTYHCHVDAYKYITNTLQCPIIYFHVYKFRFTSRRTHDSFSCSYSCHSNRVAYVNLHSSPATSRDSATRLDFGSILYIQRTDM